MKIKCLISLLLVTLPAIGQATLPTTWINSIEYLTDLTTPDFTITYPNSGTGGSWTCTGLGSFGPYTAWSQSSLNQAIADSESCRTSQNKSIKIVIPHNAGNSSNKFSGSTGVVLPQTTGDASTKFIILTSDTPLVTGQTVCSHGIQDNLAVSAQPGIRNVGCNGSNMSYTLGVTPTIVSGAFTLANGTVTNTSAYNDVASMWTAESNNNALNTAVADANNVGPHHYAILNMEARPVAGTAAVQAPVGIGQDTETVQTQIPSHIHISYSYLHGDWADAPVSGGVATGPATGFNSLPNVAKFDCIYCSYTYSYMDQALRPGSEGHGLSFLLSQQFKKVHNWIEGQSIGSLCGGFASPITITNFTVCYDMEDRANRYTYPYSWVLAQQAGYNPDSIYTSTGGSGTGATFHLLSTNGPPNQQGIFSLSVQAGGSGYALNDVLTLTSIYNSGATGGTVVVTALGASNAVSAVSIVSGSGYTAAPGLPTTGGHGTSATVTINSVSNTGGLTSVTIAGAGSGYSASDNLTVVQGGGSLGTVGVTSVGSGGAITGVNVVAGTGYALNGYVHKNNDEYKFSNRLVEDGNIFENGDFSGGQGQAISFKANQSSVVGGGDNYWTTQQNSTITNNIMRNNCSGMSGGFRSNPNNGAGGGVSDTVAFYYYVNNLMYNINPNGPGCLGSADFSSRIASDSAGTTWTANMTRTANVATANLVPAQAHKDGMFHIGDPVLAYNCTDTSFNTNAEGFPQKTLGPLAIAPTVTFGTTVSYNNTGPDVTLGNGVTCTINNVQGTPNDFYASHNSDFALSTVAQDPSSSGLASNPCVLASNTTFTNTVSTWGGASAGPIGEGTRTTNCMFNPATEAYNHNAIPGRDTRVVCPGHAAGAGGIAACYSEYSGGVTTHPPTTLWGSDTENCTTSNPQSEACLGVIGNMSTGLFNYVLSDWHNYRLCHAGDSACSSQPSKFAAGQARQASDATDMGADFTKFDPAQVSTQYNAPGTFPDIPNSPAPTNLTITITGGVTLKGGVSVH